MIQILEGGPYDRTRVVMPEPEPPTWRMAIEPPATPFPLDGEALPIRFRMAYAIYQRVVYSDGLYTITRYKYQKTE